METPHLTTSTFVRSEKRAYVYMKSNKRNLFCTITDISDKKIKFSCSYGSIKLEHKTGYAIAKLLGHLVTNKLKELKYNVVLIILNGLGSGRMPVLNNFRNSNIKVLSVKDITIAPHNGCRLKKLRRKKSRTKISPKIKKLLSPSL